MPMSGSPPWSAGLSEYRFALCVCAVAVHVHYMEFAPPQQRPIYRFLLPDSQRSLRALHEIKARLECHFDAPSSCMTLKM